MKCDNSSPTYRLCLEDFFSSECFDYEVSEDGPNRDGRGQCGHHDGRNRLLELLPPAGFGPEHHGHIVEVTVGEGEQNHHADEDPVGIKNDLREERSTRLGHLSFFLFNL